MISGRQKGLVYLAGVLPSDDGRSGLQGFGENARKGYKEDMAVFTIRGPAKKRLTSPPDTAEFVGGRRRALPQWLRRWR